MSQFRRKLLESYATNKLVYPGLIAAWSAKGKTNEDADRNVLKDLTGNGHDITLNGFAFSEMSGYGGYILSIPEIKHDGDHVLYNNYMKFKIVSATIGKQGLIFRQNGQNKRTTFKLKVKYNKTNCKLYFGKAFSIGDDKTTSILLKDGINEIPYLTWSETEKNWEGIMAVDTDNSELPTNTTLDVDVEFLPEYPDALVFDGVDDWGISKSLPILTDYTIIVKRVFLDNEKGYSGTIAAKGVNPENLGAFCFERNDNTFFSQSSFGANSRIKIDKNVEISWQTTLSYLGEAIPRGKLLDEPIFTIGTSFYRRKFLKGAIYSAYLFDRSLDDQEIKSFIRKHIDPEYLLPSGIPTPDVYYDFTNGDNSKGEANNVIKDLSGNGNDATAHNFAWNEESGYSEGGGLKFDGVDDNVATIKFSKFLNTVFCVIKSSENNKNIFEQRYKDGQQLIAQSPNNVYGSFFSLSYDNYINGILNTTITATQLQNKKHLITTVLKTAVKADGIFAIFAVLSASMNNFNNMHLYKFIGFKEKLTEEQIKAVINKYNLLDGVDNIDVN